MCYFLNNFSVNITKLIIFYYLNSASNSFLCMQNFYGSIYKITNLLNIKVYIGQTIQPLRERFKQHINSANRGENGLLNYAIAKYGVKNFKIEEIERCINLEGLNKKEIYWITQYKSNVREFGQKFGYNLSPGGKSAGSGEFHPGYKKVDKKLLKNLIKAGFNADEIAQELKIHYSTICNKTKEFWGITLLEAREEFKGTKLFEARVKKKLSKSHKGLKPSIEHRKSLSESRKGEKNVNYKKIVKKSLKSLIIEGLSGEEIARRFNINLTTVYDKTKEFWKKTLSEARESFSGKKSIQKGENHPMYKKVDKKFLIKLIKKGYNAEEIAQEINFHSVYVSKKIKELLGISLTKAREKFKGSEFFKAKVKNKRKKDINKELLKKLILQGLTFKEIAKKFQITKPTLNSRIREAWGYQNFSEAKKHF